MRPSVTITGMTYNHTQPGRWHYVLFAFALAILAGAWVAHGVPSVVVFP